MEQRTAPNRTFAALAQNLETLTLQLQNARFLAKNGLSGFAQLVDLFCREQERTVLGRLPGPRVEQFAEDELRVFGSCGHRERSKMRRMRSLTLIKVRSALVRRTETLKLTFDTQGSLLLRSNIGEGRALLMLSVPILTRRLSFSNWSIESWRTIPRSEPG